MIQTGYHQDAHSLPVPKPGLRSMGSRRARSGLACAGVRYKLGHTPRVLAGTCDEAFSSLDRL